MAIENVQQLLTEQLGKNRADVITTTAMTGKNYYCVHFPVESVVSAITASNVTTATGSTIASLHTTFAAGTTIFLSIQSITLTSGVGICYYDDVI